MSVTSKSPQDVAREALAAGTAALAPYSHKFSPKKFTQPQLLACLVSCAPKMIPLDGIDFPGKKGRKSDVEAIQ
jgi:hypothetical protein